MEAFYDRINDAATVDLPFEWNLKFRYYKDNTLDLILRKIKHHIPMSHEQIRGSGLVDYPRTLTDEELEAKRQENLLRAVRRAKQAVHFSIRQIGADHMLTLTTRDIVSSRDDFMKIFNRFVHLVRYKQLLNGRLIPAIIRKDWQYVAVPELQERGAFHMHVACVGKQDLAHLRACWYVALGGSPDDSGENTKGQIDVRYKTKRFSKRHDPIYSTFQLVGYLTKYISKGFEEDSTLGVHRYAKSRGIEAPREHNQYVMACFSNQGKGFIDAIREVLDIAELNSMDMHELSLWNRGEDIFICRGYLL